MKEKRGSIRGASRLVLAIAVATLGAAMPGSALADAGGQRHEFRVTGMSCPLCPARIQKGLEALEGVRDVEVDRKAERVSVVAAASVTPEQIEAAIEGAGHFEAEPLETP